MSGKDFFKTAKELRHYINTYAEIAADDEKWNEFALEAFSDINFVLGFTPRVKSVNMKWYQKIIARIKLFFIRRKRPVVENALFVHSTINSEGVYTPMSKISETENLKEKEDE